jgi:hypothetical protein
MNADVLHARELLRSIVDLGIQAGRELAEVTNATLLEESGLWEVVGARILPSLDPEHLQRASALAGDVDLHRILEERRQRRVDLLTVRSQLTEAVLRPADFEMISQERRQVEGRLQSLRATIKELRSRPGALDAIDAFRRGGKVRSAAVELATQHEFLEHEVHAFEQKASLLGARVARHHRARKDFDANDEQLRAVEEDALRTARVVVIERLLQAPAFSPQQGEHAHALHRIIGLNAKRTILQELFDRWVRPHGTDLVELQREGATVSGYEIVPWTARVHLRVNEASQGVDAFRRVCAQVAAFEAYDTVVDDWWGTFVPSLRPTPEPAPDSLPKGSHGGVAAMQEAPPAVVADTGPRTDALASLAADKLAAAWASLGATPSGQGAAWQNELTARSFVTPTPLDLSVLFARAAQKMPDDGLVPPPVPPPAVERSSGAAEPSWEAPTTKTASALPMPLSLRLSSSADGEGLVARPSYLAPGHRVGRFLIEGQIGKGGMGEIYRARLDGDAGFRRVVVLKRLAADFQRDPDALRMFAAEAEIAARIAHPNVVQFFDLQTHDGEPFMVMEHLEGLSLLKVSQKAKAARLSLDLAVLTRCALDAARGLHAAHSMRGDDGALVGLVHRDVSPDNLFLCSNGFTKLLDFGVARRSDLTTRTRGHELKGKIPYMSPEQIRGDRVDARSDLFSLGTTFYHLLTGQRPFVGDNDLTTLFSVVHKPHTPLRDLLQDAGELGAIVEQLMQKHPDDRPSSSLEVIRALESAGPSTPEEAAAFLARVWFG